MTGHIRRNGSERQPIDEELSDSRVQLDIILKGVADGITVQDHTGRLVQCYNSGTNAYVVKPVDFHEFVEAVRELGLFWTVVNHPPPRSVDQE